MKLTALNQIHRNQGAKMVDFAGFDMPVQYSEGILKEHEWVRGGNVGLFDVSHMGQITLEGKDVDKFLSNITPTSFIDIPNFLAKYTVLTNENGGIIDDLIISRLAENKFFIVINAGCKEKDISWIKSNLPSEIKLDHLEDRSLIAIQGEKSELILQQFIEDKKLSDLPYMNIGYFKLKNGEDVYISRTGYTGEDGFEISIKNDVAAEFWLKLCEGDIVKPIGLGARDSLRLEVGYPLYGHDLDDTTSPIEASLSWVVSKDNNGFIGEKRILKEKIEGTKRKRVGIKLLDKGIARENTEIFIGKEKIGALTSGGFSPSLKLSIGQAYIKTEYSKIGTEVEVEVRNRRIPALISSTVFVSPKTKSIKNK